jgi:hypothetical protein
VALELAREVGLVVEAHPGGDQRDRLPFQEALADHMRRQDGDGVAAGGAALSRMVEGGGTQRAVDVALALLLAASVAFNWV